MKKLLRGVTLALVLPKILLTTLTACATRAWGTGNSWVSAPVPPSAENVPSYPDVLNATDMPLPAAGDSNIYAWAHGAQHDIVLPSAPSEVGRGPDVQDGLEVYLGENGSDVTITAIQQQNIIAQLQTIYDGYESGAYPTYPPYSNMEDAPYGCPWPIGAPLKAELVAEDLYYCTKTEYMDFAIELWVILDESWMMATCISPDMNKTYAQALENDYWLVWADYHFEQAGGNILDYRNAIWHPWAPGNVQPDTWLPWDSNSKFKTTAELNFQKGPGMAHESMRLIPQGAVVRELGRVAGNDGWLYVNHENVPGWVSMDWLTPLAETGAAGENGMDVETVQKQAMALADHLINGNSICQIPSCSNIPGKMQT